jgi:type I restriction enzyme S subunit
MSSYFRDTTLDAEKNVGVPKPYIGNKAVQWDRIDISDLPTVPMSRADLGRFRLQKGDLLVCEGGEVGRAAIWDAPVEECYYQKALHRLRPLHGFDSRLMVAMLRQWSDGGLLANYVTQTSIAHLPREKFLELPMPLPTPAEQRAIAGVLSDVDALLGALDQLIAKKGDLKQAATQQLLTGKTRLPGFEGEWTVKQIGGQIDLLTGFPFSSSQYTESGVRLLRGSNVKRGETDWSADLVQCWPKISSEIAQYELQGGDLVISMDGSLVGRSYARLSETDLPAVLLQRVARIRSETIDIGFLTQFIGSDRFIKYCDSVKTVTAIPHISSADIRNFSIPLPPSKAEQIAIAEVLSDMDAELAALEQRRAKTHALKQGMMQELLTGRTRLV